MKNQNDWMESEMKGMMKSVVKTMLPFWIVGGLISIGVVVGIIYFICWILNYYGVI
jgi:hypothetical protein